jgi:hypothetical protein
MTVQFEDIRCPALSGICDHVICKLFEYTIVSILVRFGKIAFGSILSESKMIGFSEEGLGCKRDIAKTFTVGQLPEHQNCKLIPAGKRLDVLVASVFL